MTSWATLNIDRQRGAEQRSATGALPVGSLPALPPGTEPSLVSEWLIDGQPSVGDDDIAVEVQSKTRRHLVIIVSGNQQWSSRWPGGGSGFSWNGGLPPAAVDISQWQGVPGNQVYGYSITTHGLTILTDRLEPGRLTIETGGAVLFLEGEEEADFRVRTPAAGAGGAGFFEQVS